MVRRGIPAGPGMIQDAPGGTMTKITWMAAYVTSRLRAVPER